METKKILTRNITTEQPQLIRSEGENTGQYIEGYAIVFNQRSKLIREWGETFYEVVEPAAVDNVLNDPDLNVIATVDHNRSKMLGRTKSGTLELIKDSHGLKYRIKIPNTTLGNDMAEMVSRGDYFESSFIFSIAEKGLRYERSEEIPTRYISEFSSLRDIAVVVDGAYANTAVQLRFQEWETDEPNAPKQTPGQNYAIDILEKEIETLKH